MVPCATVQGASGALLVYSAPLFEEEGDTSLKTLVTEGASPLDVHWSSAGPGLSTRYYPVYSGQINIQRAEKWLSRDEPHRSRDSSEVVDAVSAGLALYRHTHPQVLRPIQFRRKLAQSLSALGQDLKCMLLGAFDCVKHPLDELQRHFLMEDVAHGVHKNHLWLSPGKGQFDEIVV